MGRRRRKAHRLHETRRSFQWPLHRWRRSPHRLRRREERTLVHRPRHQNPHGPGQRLNGKLLNGPNDVWLRPDGGLYFTDPFYKREYWKRGAKEQDGEHVYYLSPDRKTFTRVTTDLKQPNGIIGTPDGKMLYV